MRGVRIAPGRKRKREEREEREGGGGAAEVPLLEPVEQPFYLRAVVNTGHRTGQGADAVDSQGFRSRS